MSQEPDQSPDDARPVTRSDADVTSETRHGPRPVPEGHRPASGRQAPRRSPPHGDVSPDGTRPWPSPSRGARWLVWGGTALATAALTVGAVLATRKVVDLLTDDDDRPARPPVRDAQPGRRAQHLGLMQEIEANTASLSQSVEDVMHALGTAVAGFRSVAGTTGSILREFDDAADLLRSVMERRSGASTTAKSDPGDDPLRHEPMTDPDDYDPRLHRL